MRMRPTIFAVLLSVACSGVAVAQAETYEVDPVHSLVLYRIMHLGIAPSYGVFTGISGEITFDPDQLDACRAKIQVDPLTINSFHSGRDQHLKSAEFLNVDEHFAMVFESTSWTRISGQGAQQEFEVEGTLNFLGILRPIKARVVHGGFAKGKNGEQKTGFEATFSFRRSDFGMTAYLPDNLSDEIRITVALELVRKDARGQ